MGENYSESLKRFRELIKNDNKRRNGAKIKNEKRDLLYWFVDNSPSLKGSETSLKFSDYGIIKGYDFRKLKDRILTAVGLKKEVTYKYFESGKEMEAQIEEIEKLYQSRRRQIIFFSKGEGSEMDSLYIRIRNSFAHGNYFKKGEFYYLWNETGAEGKTKKIGSFMVLKFSDLKAIFDALRF